MYFLAKEIERVYCASIGLSVQKQQQNNLHREHVFSCWYRRRSWYNQKPCNQFNS